MDLKLFNTMNFFPQLKPFPFNKLYNVYDVYINGFNIRDSNLESVEFFMCDSCSYYSAAKRVRLSSLEFYFRFYDEDLEWEFDEHKHKYLHVVNQLVISVGLFVCNSTLNGNNGSWTNSDDVSLENKHFVRKIVKKEARNRLLHSSSTSHKSKIKTQKNCNDYVAGNCARGEKCRFAHPKTDVPEEKPSVKEPEVAEKEESFMFSGIEYKLLKKAVSCKDGTADQDICSNANIPEFVHFGRVFINRDVVISHRLAMHITSCLRILPDESRNYTALLNFVTELMQPVFSARCVMDHVYFYAFRNKSKASPASVSAIAQANYVCLNSSQVTTIPMVIGPEIKYTYNQSWKIIKSEGFKMDVSADRPGEFIRYPSFETKNLDIKVTNKNKRSFCSFTPVNNFIYLANCASNVEVALSRYFQTRVSSLEEDLYMRQSQFKLLGLQCLQDVATVARICDADVDTYIYETRLKMRPCYCNYIHRNHRQTFNISNQESPFLKLLEDNWFKTSFSVICFFMMFIGYIESCFTTIWNSVVLYVYSPFFQLYDLIPLLREFALLPHPKQFLRLKWVVDERSIDRILANTGDFESKLKWEPAKVNKAGRLYASICENSLVGYFCSHLIKFMTMQPLVHGPLSPTANFSSMYSDASNPSISDRLFGDILQMPEGSCKFIYFSDDGFVVHKVDGECQIYETDIKSCDASNGFSVSVILMFLARHLGFVETMLKLLAISSKSTVLRNPDKRSEYVMLRPESTFEYSGEPLTTAKNNVANIGIAFGAYQRMLLGQSLGDSLINGSKDYGWVLTVSAKQNFNSVTFLKRAYSVRASRSWVVYGTIFRSFGILDGPPSSKMFGLSDVEFKKLSFSDMFELHVKMRVDSLVNEPSSSILNALRERAYGRYSIQKDLHDDDIIERYGCEQHHIDEFVGIILNLKLGDCVVCPFLEHVYSVDYGTTPVFRELETPNALSSLDDII
jgi:hypothetical protein